MSTLLVILMAFVLVVLVPVPGVAAETNPGAADPGPTGDFSWKGFNWEKRRWGGAPNHSGQFDPANVSGPDANGHVTLTLTNPTGQAAVAAEFNTTRRGFGYGTYSTTVEKDLSTLQKEVVWGCLFTYDAAVAPGYNEIDLCEASAWGGGSDLRQPWPITQGHGYWFDATKAPGIGNDTTVFGVTDHRVLTHRLIWEPRKLTFETFVGEGHSGPLLKRTVLEGEKVPRPAGESIHVNLWVTGGGGGNPARVKPEKVVVRDFSFTPAAKPITTAPVPAPPTSPSPTAAPTIRPEPSPSPVRPTPTPVPGPAIELTSTTSTVRGTVRTTLSWSGARGRTVTLVSNDVRQTLRNTGRAVVKAGSGSVRYMICDASRCSPEILVRR